MGNHPLPGYGSVTSGNRLVRTRLLGGVGAGGEIPPATRLTVIFYDLFFDVKSCRKAKFFFRFVIVF
jgi:hypothetical protein